MGLGQGLGSTLHLKGWGAAWEAKGRVLLLRAADWGETGRFGDECRRWPPRLRWGGIVDQGANALEWGAGGILWPSTKFCLPSCSSEMFPPVWRRWEEGQKLLERVLQVGVGRNERLPRASGEASLRVRGAGTGARPGTGSTQVFPKQKKTPLPR